MSFILQAIIRKNLNAHLEMMGRSDKNRRANLSKDKMQFLLWICLVEHIVFKVYFKFNTNFAYKILYGYIAFAEFLIV
jgi:hypothetical protein